MSKLSRRSLVAGAASLPALVAGPAVAAAIEATESDPVIALVDRVIALWNEAEAACHALAPFETAMFEWKVNNPPPQKPDIVGVGVIRTGRMISIMQKPEAEAARFERKHHRAEAAWEKRKQREAHRCGYAVAERAQEDATDRLSDAINLLCETPPRTMAGLVAKARVARLVSDDALSQEIAFDIGIMSGELVPSVESVS